MKKEMCKVNAKQPNISSPDLPSYLWKKEEGKGRFTRTLLNITHSTIHTNNKYK